MKTTWSFARWSVLCASVYLLAGSAFGQGATAKPQPNDEEYTKRIKDYLQDSRFTSDLVDHLPASSKVPTPLKFLGTMPGQPGELYYTKDIDRYYEELAKDSPRAKFWKMRLKSEEGRDMVVLAIGNEEAIKNLEKYKGDLAALTDPRKTTEERFTGSPAASTPPRPADRRCWWSWRIG